MKASLISPFPGGHRRIGLPRVRPLRASDRFGRGCGLPGAGAGGRGLFPAVAPLPRPAIGEAEGRTVGTGRASGERAAGGGGGSAPAGIRPVDAGRARELPETGRKDGHRAEQAAGVPAEALSGSGDAAPVRPLHRPEPVAAGRGRIRLAGPHLHPGVPPALLASRGGDGDREGAGRLPPVRESGTGGIGRAEGALFGKRFLAVSKQIRYL